MSTVGRLTARLRRIDLVRLDQVIAAVLLVQTELHVWSVTNTADRFWPAIGGALFCVPVAFRRRRPLSGMLVLLTAVAVKTAISTAPGPLSGAGALLPSLLLLVYAVGAFAPPRRSRWVFGLTLVVAGVNAAVTPGKAATLPFSLLFVGVLPYVLGRMMRARAERAAAERREAERIDAELDVRADSAVSEERVRIARELHDVIAHSVSIMVIQAGGARLVMDSSPERAEASLRNVERAGRDALAEMRRLLGLLDGGRGRDLTPQPGLAELLPLLSRANEAGLDTTLHLEGEARLISPALDLCAYRVVQEALTNAIKYAAPGHADISIRWRPPVVELEISDDGHGYGHGQSHDNMTPSGHGLAGMRERVSLHGGNVCTGPHGAGFVVRAVLPLDSAARLP
jgi:signal transduction histidine kinase